MTGNSSITINISTIWDAWQAFRRGKKSSLSILKFEEHLGENLLKLTFDLQTGLYQHEKYAHKIVSEKKRRDIYVASVRDRIVHRLVYDHLMPTIDKKLDFDVWSCRKDKGLHACLARCETLLKRYPGAYIWRCDIHKFFDSIPHDQLMKVVNRSVRCQQAKDLLSKIILSYSNSSTKQKIIGGCLLERVSLARSKSVCQ
jgi:RNA-directed DNA polymerase